MSARNKAFQSIVGRLSVLFNKQPEELNDGTRFQEDLGAKSANISQLINFLEDEFEIEISFMEFRRRETVGGAADYIAELCED